MYKASIIVAFNNEYTLTENFFENIFKIINKDIQIISVIDGAPDILTYQYLDMLQKKHNNLKVIYQDENKGYSIANNKGASCSNAEYLIFLNSDTFPVDNAIYTMISYMDSHQDTGVAQGLIIYPQTNKVQSAGHIFGFFKTSHAFDGRNISDDIIQKEASRQALGSGFYITRRNLFCEEKGFDEIFYNAWEGLEYSLKIHFRGLQCMYIPSAMAYHVKGSGRNRIFRDETYQTGYFWNKWGNKIKMDLPDIYAEQISDYDYKQTYFLLNGSSIRDNIWKIILSDLNIQFTGFYNIQKAIGKNTISLEDSVPSTILQSQNNLLFTTDNYYDISNNFHMFQLRKNANTNDLIIDLHGNVIRLSELRA